MHEADGGLALLLASLLPPSSTRASHDAIAEATVTFEALAIAALVSGPQPPEQKSCSATIPALVERLRPGPVVQRKTRDLVAVPIEDVIASAELGVEGTIRSLRTYLSEDRCTIYTDYALQPADVFYAAPGRQPAPSDIVVTTYGGVMQIAGVTVDVTDEQLPPFQEGRHLILLLQRTTRNGKATYQPVFEVAGAFAVDGSRVKHMLVAAGAATFAEMDKAALIARVRRR